MKKKKKNIAFDLDGVVYNLLSPLNAFMKGKGLELIDNSQYDLGKRYGVSKQEGLELLKEWGKTRPFLNMPLCERAKQEMIKLRNHNLYIITHRDWTEQGIEDTLKRVKLDNLPVKPENIIFSKKKSDWAKKLKIDLFYEDSTINANYILSNSDAKVILIDAPYNQDFEGNVTRLKW